MGRPGPLEQLLNLAGQFFLHFKQSLVCEAVVIAEVGKKFATVLVHVVPEKHRTREQFMMLPQKAMGVIAPVIALPAAVSRKEKVLVEH